MNYPNGIQKNSTNNIINYGNRGMVLEDDLNITNEYYREGDIAIIYKKPTPITIHKVNYKSRDNAFIEKASFKIPSTTDYNGIYKGKYIFYSLGNFVFNMTWERARYGAIVSLNVITGTVGYDYIYINNKYFPEIIVEEQVPSNMRFTFLNTLLHKNDNIEEYCQTFQKYLNQYRRATRSDIIRNLYRSDIAFTFSIFKDFVSRKIKK